MSSGALLAGVVEQPLRDVLPDRVAAIQSDCIGGLDFHGPLAATAILGFTATDAETAQSVYVSMDRIALLVVLPTVLSALLSGLVEGFITHYGVFRQTWVRTKLVLTAVALIVLVAKIPLIGRAVRIVRLEIPVPEIHFVGLQLLVHSAGGLAVLLAALALSVYKPN